MTSVDELLGDRPDVLVLRHAAIAPSGLWVVEVSDAIGRVRVTGPQLSIGGRDEGDLLAALGRRVRAVAAAVEDAAPVCGAICLTRANLPLLRTAKVDGFPVLSPRGLVKRVTADGPLDAAQRHVLADVLERRLR